MANGVPPPPIGAASGSYAWIEWYTELTNFLNSGGTVSWTSINFTGSNITSILTRNHNDLQNIQGGGAGNRYHLASPIYVGTCVADASSSVLPSGWGVSHSSTGNYIITHNLGITPTEWAVVANVTDFTAPGYVSQILPSTDGFVINTVSSPGTGADKDFNFLMVKQSN